jgi:hypothetical protein
MGVGVAPAESPPVLREHREVFAGNTRPIQITVATADPILLADAHGGLALPPRVGTSRPRLAIAARHRGSPSRLDCREPSHRWDEAFTARR